MGGFGADIFSLLMQYEEKHEAIFEFTAFDEEKDDLEDEIGDCTQLTVVIVIYDGLANLNGRVCLHLVYSDI